MQTSRNILRFSSNNLADFSASILPEKILFNKESDGNGNSSKSTL